MSKRGARLAALIAIAALTLAFFQACSRDAVTQVTGPQPEDSPELLAKVADTSASTDFALAKLDALMRTVPMETEMFELLSDEAEQNEGVYRFRVKDAEAPDILPGTIVVGGEERLYSRQVETVSRDGEILELETTPFDWTALLQDEEDLVFTIPLTPGTGQERGVSWDEWELTTVGGIPVEDSPAYKGGVGLPGLPDFASLDICQILETLADDDSNGHTSSTCGAFRVEVVDPTHFNVGGSANVTFTVYKKCVLGLCVPYGFRAAVDVSESIDSRLTLQFSGSLSQELAIPCFGARKTFRIGSYNGKVELAVNLTLGLELQGPTFETFFDFHQEARGGAAFKTTNMSFSKYFTMDSSFSSGIEMIDIGGASASIALGPDLGVGFGGFDVSAGAAAYLRAGVETHGVPEACTTWRAAFVAGAEASAGAGISWNIFGLRIRANAGWEWPFGEIVLADYWGKGDWDLDAVSEGVDPDYDGYRVHVRLLPPEDPDEVHPAFNPRYFDVDGDRGLIDGSVPAARYEIEVTDLMWNCEVVGENPRIVCVSPFGTSNDEIRVRGHSIMKALADIVEDGEQRYLIDPVVSTLIQKKLAQCEFARRESAAPEDAQRVFGELVVLLRENGLTGIAPPFAAELRDHAALIAQQYLASPGRTAAPDLSLAR